MDKETLISTDKVYRYYGDYCAVENLGFTVSRGEVLGFLGPNGAGKSTTMQILCGVLTPNSGNVSIAGIDMHERPREAKQHLGFLPEQPPLYPDQTVDEYLSYAARLRGLSKNAVAGAVERSKKRCGLEQTGRRMIKNLSKGFQQRVGIAQAVLHSPAVIILDEPTSGLDPIQIREIRDLIRELGEDHSIILSTHILSEVQSVCNRVLIINNGRLVFDQSIASLGDNKQKTRIIAGFKNLPQAERLLQIPGVEQVENIDPQHLLIELETQSNALDDLLSLAVEQGYGLSSLIPQTDTLEEIFIRLTSTGTDTTTETGETSA